MAGSQETQKSTETDDTRTPAKSGTHDNHAANDAQKPPAKGPRPRRLPPGKKGVQRRPKGRPTTLNRRIINKITKLVAEGKPERVAAQIVGISSNTLSGWYNRGLLAEHENETEGNGPLFRDFALKLDKARGLALAVRLDRIDKAAAGGATVREKTGIDKQGNTYTEKQYAAPDWRADAFVLERTQGEFKKAQQLELSGTVRHEQVSLNLQLDDIPPGKLIELAATLRKMIPAQSAQSEQSGSEAPPVAHPALPAPSPSESAPL